MQLLGQLIERGDLPVLPSCQLDANSNYHQASTNLSPSAAGSTEDHSPTKGWTSSLLRMIRRHQSTESSGSPTALPNPPDDTTPGSGGSRSLFRRRQRPTPPQANSGKSTPQELLPTPPPSTSELQFPTSVSCSTYATPSPPRVRVRSVTLCLFPAEDRNRVCLRYV